MATKKILIQIQVGAKDANIAVANVTKAMEGLSDAQVKVSKTTKNSTASAGLHNAILMEAGRTASDLNYGFSAIANNLGQLFSLFQASANSAEGLGAAFRKLISIQAVLLIGGQLLIQNLDKIFKFVKEVVFSIQDLSKVFDKASKTVLDVNGSFEIYIATLEDSTKSEEEKAIAVKKLNDEYPDYISNLEKAEVSIEDVKNKTEAATKQNDLYRESILELAISRAAQNEIEKISGEILQEEIDLRKLQEEAGIKNDKQLTEALINKQKEIDAEQLIIDTKKLARAQSNARYASDSILDETKLNALKNEKKALEGNLESYLGFGETANERIKRLKEERDLYIEYVKLGRERNKIDEKTKQNQENEPKINEGLLDRILKDNIRLENITAKFSAKSVEDDFARKRAELKAQEKYQIDVINLTEGFETEKEKARLATQIYYAKLRQDNRDEEKEAIRLTQLSIVGFYGKAVGSMGKLFKQGSDASKAAALTEIGINTALGFVQGLDIAQKSSKAAGPLAAFAFPLFYAQQIAAVLGAASQAKQILSSGGKSTPSGSISVSGGQVSVEAPDFNVVGAGGVSQLATTLAGVTGQPLKAFVVSKEITSAQELERNITDTASVG